MNKFKEGEEIWFFSFPDDGCNHGFITEIELNKSIINAPEDYYNMYWSTEYGLLYKELELFSTKKDALNALKKRIIELENDDTD